MAIDDDPFAFLFDKTIRDRTHNLEISVTRSDARDEDIQININSISDHSLRITLFLNLFAADDLGRALIMAGEAEEKA